MLTRFRDFDSAFAMMDEFRRRMDRLMGDFDFDGYRSPWREADVAWPLRAAGWPPSNLLDAGGNIVLTSELPGLDHKEVKLSINQDVLTVSGERKIETPEGYTAVRQERYPFRFSRSFALPCKVDSERTTAQLKDGVLTVTMAKAPEAQPRQITVRATA